MGKAFGYIVFLGFFVVFVIIKHFMRGAKAAYEAVFDPNAKDDRVRRLLETCIFKVSNLMNQRYSGNVNDLPSAILHLTPVVQSMILEAGYKAPAHIAQAIVCDGIVIGNHATRLQVNEALRLV